MNKENCDDSLVTDGLAQGSNVFKDSGNIYSCDNIEIKSEINNNSKNYYDSKVPLSPDNHAVGNQGFEHRKTEEMREM